MNAQSFDAADATDVRSRTTSAAVVLFVTIAVLIGWDVAADYQSGTEIGHLVMEALVMALALAGAIALWRQLRSTRTRADQLTADLSSARREADRFRQDAHLAIEGLGQAIDRQFTRWALSPAEREVGLLLLKGLSHKEIAAARSTSETTIRQQALSVYRKSGLRSRAELSAFFLEDLLLPAAQR